MQDVLVRDMFNLSDVNNTRYNGHVQVSSCPKIAGGKRDRKGCTKGKIEAIMKNNSVRPKICIAATNKKLPSSIPVASQLQHSTPSNHVIYPNQVGKLTTDHQEDPYAFVEPEPQSPSVYHHQQQQQLLQQALPQHLTAVGTLSCLKKPPVRTAGMVCPDRSKVEPSKMVARHVRPSEGMSKISKLQAELARSRAIPKRRKTEPISPNRFKMIDVQSLISKKEPISVSLPPKREPRRSTWQRERNAKHELLERIHQMQSNMKEYKKDLYPLGLELSDSDSDESFDSSEAVYERNWFSKSEALSFEDSPRERRVESTRIQVRRRLTQTLRALKVSEVPSSDYVEAVVEAARKFPNATASILDSNLTRKPSVSKRGARFLLTGEKCSYSEGCWQQALPCTRHCFQHVMYNVDQRLFSHCTNRGVDNVQCNRPGLDIKHDPPLCAIHQVQHTPTSHHRTDSRHKKVSKKSRMLNSYRNSKRNNKKKKRHSPTRSRAVDERTSSSSSSHDLHRRESGSSASGANVCTPQALLGPTDAPVEVNPDDIVEEEVLAIANLDPAELVNQASRLLEEHDDLPNDIANVFNQIPPDAFNDLFGDKNGEYEPTREETEELERALEAVNDDVRSLERMSRALPLLQLPFESFLNDPVVTADPFPTFHNGLPPPATATDLNHS